jgi:hypothetical protein
MPDERRPAAGSYGCRVRTGLPRTHTANRTTKPEGATLITHRTTQVDGLSVFYREAGDPGSPKLLLLGGFPSSSHQFRNLIPALADRFHVLSLDYPGLQHRYADDFNTPSTGSRRSLRACSRSPSSTLRALPPGLRRSDRQPHRRAPPGLARVAGDPELERLRGGLHRRLGRHPPRALGRPQLRDGGAAAAVPRVRRRQLVYTWAPQPNADQPDNWNMDLRLERPSARKSLDLPTTTAMALYPQCRPSCESGRRR